jgi:hypothetical protein
MQFFRGLGFSRKVVLNGLRRRIETCRFPSARRKGSTGNRHGRGNNDGFGGGSESRRDKG